MSLWLTWAHVVLQPKPSFRNAKHTLGVGGSMCNYAEERLALELSLPQKVWWVLFKELRSEIYKKGRGI